MSHCFVDLVHTPHVVQRFVRSLHTNVAIELYYNASI